MNIGEFVRGNEFFAYEYFGAHICDIKGVVFRTYAPNAAGVALIGDFNDWQGISMNLVDRGVYEVYIEDAVPGQMYKYRIYLKNGGCVEHCDPYGFGMELRPNFASVIRNLNDYTFKDEKWLEKRTDCKDKPLNIYEIHAGSWKKKDDEWYSYAELADLLIPYLKENGYNYIEFLPLAEHPCDESWGYQCTGYFSPTSRYGTILELMELIDKCHAKDIGVIFDFVPVHFAIDYYALAKYDGTNLYEYPESDVSKSEWGSCNFFHARGEVQSFLKSAANFWIDRLHFDGIRMDAISNMIYWMGDKKRGVNIRSIEFIKSTNDTLKRMHKGIILSAEDSTSFPKVTTPACYGGLGFDYKWDMGWMHDTLELFQAAPEYRSRDYHKLTFSMAYFREENYLMPLSHDEVVHGKATILQKMNGEYEDKFPQGRTLYLYMYAHPGKKLNFMGNEFGQLREWDEKREQDFDILKYPKHKEFADYMKDLNKIYLKNSPLWAKDYSEDGFRWVDCNKEADCIYSFIRSDGESEILTVINLSDEEKEYNYALNEGETGKLLIDTDDKKYGGEKKYTAKDKNVKDEINLKLSKFSGVMYLITKQEK